MACAVSGHMSGVFLGQAALGAVDLSRFDAAPLKGFTVTKETDYVTETEGRIPPRCSADCTDERADAETGS